MTLLSTLLHAQEDPLAPNDYATLMQTFSASRETTPPATVDHELVSAVTNPRNKTPMFFLGLNSSGRSMVIHSIQKLPDNFLAPSAWYNKLFATLGDVDSTATPSTTVEITPEFLAVAQAGRPFSIPTPSRLDELLAASPTADRVALPEDEQENTAKRPLRQWCPLPAKYAALALPHHHWTPRDLWINLVGQIRQDNAEQALQPIVAWVTAACLQDTTITTAQPTRTSSILADHTFLRHRAEVTATCFRTLLRLRRTRRRAARRGP